MKRSINHKRYSGYPEELSMLKGFKVVGVGCGDIDNLQNLWRRKMQPDS